jgi:hypothetical protein
MMKDKEICTLYESGLTIREISERINFSYEKVRLILKSNKIKWRKNYLSDFTNDQIQNIINRFNNKETIEEIAKWYEISPPAISRLLKSKNIEVTPLGRKYDILRETPINTIQKQFLIGCILGDGCLYKDSENSNYKLSFGHCKAQEQYFHWKIMMMDPFINGFRESNDKRGNSIMLQAATITHKDFNYFAKLFYTHDRKKIIPDNLDMFFTPLSLAVWIMDDGNLNEGVNMRIATMSFTEQENYKLQDYLKRCFDLNSKVMGFKYKGKQYYQLTLNKKNTQKLSDIIRPYIVDCMKYKLMPESSTTTC